MQDNGSRPGTSHEIRIANEFAAVTVRQRRTRAGTRLELYSERTDRAVDIDAVGLEALCWLTPEAISRLVTIISEVGGPIEDRKL
jgi:hypothetical protein